MTTTAEVHAVAEARPEGGGESGAGHARARAIVAGVTWTLVSRVASIAAALGAQIVIARVLGPGGNGVVTGAGAVLALAMLAADLGVNTSVSRLLAAAYYRDPTTIPRIVRLGFFLKLALTVAVGAGLYLGAGPLARAIGSDAADAARAAPVIAMCAIQLVLDNFATFAFRGLQGLHLPGRNAASQAFSGIGSPIATAALVISGFGPVGAVCGRAIGAGFAALIGTYQLLVGASLASRQPPQTEPGTTPSASPGALGSPGREIAAYARRIFWVQVAFLMFFRLDRALVFRMLGEHAAGLYALPANIVEQCLLPATSISVVAAPYFAAAADRARWPFLRGLLARSLRVITGFYVPAAVGLIVLAPDAVRVVFGIEYTGVLKAVDAAGAVVFRADLQNPAGSVPILRAHALALFVLAYVTMLGAILDYMGMGRLRALAFGAAALADLGLNVVLIPRLGPIGPVVALLVTVTPLTIFYIARVARGLGLSVRQLGAHLARSGAAAAVMTGAVVAARAPFERVNGPVLAGLVAVGVVAYAAALYAIGGISREDLDALRGLRGGSAGGEAPGVAAGADAAPPPPVA